MLNDWGVGSQKKESAYFDQNLILTLTTFLEAPLH